MCNKKDAADNKGIKALSLHVPCLYLRSQQE